MAQTGYTPIQIYNSTTTGNTPSTNVQGELACNITDKKLWIGNGSSNVQLLGTGADVNADNVVAAKGVYAKTAMTATYGDGIVLDYTTGIGRFSVGSNDGFAWYNGGVANTQIANMGVDGTLNVPNTFGFKNRIINGAMMIDQRNAGASVTPTASETYTLDRWNAYTSQASKFSVQRNAGSVTPPNGYTNYLGVTSLSAFSLGSSDYCLIGQRIEAFNVADFGLGASGAATFTISFWVRSSLTGTFGGVANNNSNYSYPFTYTINSANTWEQKFVTIVGPTAGTWGTGNSTGLGIAFSLGAGSSFLGTAGSWAATGYLGATGQTNMVSTNGATFYITGVQLEKGSTATSFDYRPYGTELALCQRYCINYNSANANGVFYRYCYGDCVSTVVFNGGIQLPTTMRITPSVTTTGTASNYAVYSRATVTALSAILTIGSDGSSNINLAINATVASGLTQGSAGALISNNNQTSYLLFSAEL